ATYTWKTVGSVVGTGSSLSVSPGNTTTYQVECTSCGSCTATQVTLTVTPPPVKTCPGTGSLSYERWNNIAGTSIAELLSKTNN
ncbi:hypothetical protein J2I47_26435, partial [Fibrella sp. HMF5335]